MVQQDIFQEILEKKFISVSWGDASELPKIVYPHVERFELFTSEAWKMVNNILNEIPKEAQNEAKRLCHVTYEDKSERDVYAHYCAYEGQHVLIEISHNWIDPHFIWFQLWWPDSGQKIAYPINKLFNIDAIKGAYIDGKKFGEVFVNPTIIYVRATDVGLFKNCPSHQELSQYAQEIKSFPIYRFWQEFNNMEYESAGNSLLRIFSKTNIYPFTEIKSETVFFLTLYAVCLYLSGAFEKATKLFIRLAKYYSELGIKSYSDTCFFFAIESSKRIADLNMSTALMSDIVDNLPFVNDQQKKEIQNILNSYCVNVFIGVAVMSRRLIEIHLTEILVIKYGKSIIEQIQEGIKNGVVPKNMKRGLCAILLLAKNDRILSDDEYTIAWEIKDFGNRIHESGSISNQVDAKYAIQACLHLLHRLIKGHG